MATIKDLKKRILSTKTTQQTTKAMKMVSAAKLRRATEAVNNQRPYAKRIGALIKLFANMPEIPKNSPLLAREDTGAVNRKKRVALVLVTSDRGLCAGFNSNIIKAAQRWVVAHQSEYESIELHFVGRKAYDFLKNKNYQIGAYYADLGGKVTFAKAKKLAHSLIDLYLSGHVDEVKIIFNEFINAVTQKVTIDNFLPLSTEAGPTVDQDTAAEQTVDYIVKPSPAEVFEELLNKHFTIQAFRIMLDSQAGEHGARMSAMENATKNAEEVVSQLTLEYNKQRQAGITKELLEIIAGSESQKVS